MGSACEFMLKRLRRLQPGTVCQECTLQIGMGWGGGERSGNFSSLLWLHTVTGLCPWQVKKKKKVYENQIHICVINT